MTFSCSCYIQLNKKCLQILSSSRCSWRSTYTNQIACWIVFSCACYLLLCGLSVMVRIITLSYFLPLPFLLSLLFLSQTAGTSLRERQDSIDRGREQKANVISSTMRI